MDETILEKIKQLVTPLLDSAGVELADLFLIRERGKAVLRFLVDRSPGITLDECARLNRQIGQLIDQEEDIQESYILEVSSPGLDRPLKSTRDFQRLKGQMVKIVLHQPLNARNVLLGYIEQVEDDKIVIKSTGGQMLLISRQNIARANLEVEV